MPPPTGPKTDILSVIQQRRAEAGGCDGTDLDGGWQRPSHLSVRIRFPPSAALEEGGAGPLERTLVLVGAKGSGKTSLLARFLEKSEANPKPTQALEYTYRRGSTLWLFGRIVGAVFCFFWQFIVGNGFFGPLSCVSYSAALLVTATHLFNCMPLFV